ncbi:hypothetical protein FOPE_10633 [Fonsecaea pedrosoi]|nr:hypothetical protein FOPE_10633 [Fonsecaea pedrosoi]
MMSSSDSHLTSANHRRLMNCRSWRIDWKMDRCVASTRPPSRQTTKFHAFFKDPPELYGAIYDAMTGKRKRVRLVRPAHDVYQHPDLETAITLLSDFGFVEENTPAAATRAPTSTSASSSPEVSTSQKMLLAREATPETYIERCEIPHLHGVHFVIRCLLGAGVSTSVKMDALGKASEQVIASTDSRQSCFPAGPAKIGDNALNLPCHCHSDPPLRITSAPRRGRKSPSLRKLANVRTTTKYLLSLETNGIPL